MSYFVENEEDIVQSAGVEAGKLRVAVYCRPSAQMKGQQNSPEEQAGNCMKIIGRNKDWTLAGVYAERAKKNTRAQWPQFRKLIRDCESGLIDCVLCESVSRLLRIDRTEIQTINHLRDTGIRFVFEKDGIDTDNTLEILLTILTSFAEEKIRSLSESSRQKRRKRAQAGETFYQRLYGYKKAEDSYEILPDEAEVVRMVFRCYEHGASSKEVARILSGKGIAIPSGRHNHWDANSIRMMIENEKYAGDYRTQKYYKDAYGNEYKNDGALPSVYHRDHHPAIIEREQFERCQVILNLRKKNTPLDYPFGEYLRCPYCGHVMYKRRAPKTQCLCCEGEGACRQFVIKAAPVEKAILEAYEKIKMKAVDKKAALRDYSIAIEAVKFLRTKAEHPVFERIDFWWLDDLVEQISFGQHTCINDRTISIHWRCGLMSTLPTGVKEGKNDPRIRAERWDVFILEHPDRYPHLADEILKRKDASSSGSL